MAYIPGIDVSHWQNGINWQQVKSAGIAFAIIKATEGTGFVDDCFARNWQESKAVGILRGAYHYFWPSLDPEEQAALFLKTVKLEPGDLPPALDMEKREQRISNKRTLERMKVWMDTVEKATGVKPIIYTGPAYCIERLSQPNGLPPSWVNDYVLWLANYVNYAPGVLPFMPPGWNRWKIWQHSESGRLPGINNNVDLDWFDGSEEELYALAGAKAPVKKKEEKQKEEKKTTGELRAAAQLYVVQKGETLKEISVRYNIKLPELIKANPHLLQPKRKLVIPATNEKGEMNEGHISWIYEVAGGDTLSAIADRYHTTVGDLLAANGINDPNRIEVGQKLIII